MNEVGKLFARNGKFNQACILVGSNIDPILNCRLAVQELSQIVEIQKASCIWETEAIGSTGENFLNFALLAFTTFDIETLKEKVLKPLEIKLGRVRSKNKNAPRTMDLDVILFNGRMVDEKIWEQYFCALPVSELYPDYLDKKTGKTLKSIAVALTGEKIAICRNELKKRIFIGVL